MDGTDFEYIASERFIHDALIGQVEELLKDAWSFWKTSPRLPALVVAWPRQTIQDDHGAPINDKVVLQLPEGLTSNAIQKLVERTKAYAILTVEDTDGGMIALFESQHGTRRWEKKAIRVGDSKRLGPLFINNDVPAHGLLWKPRG
jgi:hypothetical protein